MQTEERNQESFTKLIHFIEMKQCAVKKLILAQEEAAMKKAEDLLERLPNEICDLKKRDFVLQHLEQLSRTDNSVHFLQVGSLNKKIFEGL